MKISSCTAATPYGEMQLLDDQKEGGRNEYEEKKLWRWMEGEMEGVKF